MEKLALNPNRLWKYKELILSKVDIIEILKEYDVYLEETGMSDNFTHKAYCPFHEGKEGGRERTPSFFVSKHTNTFYCFSCGKGRDACNFVSYMEGTPQIIALEKLAKRVGLIDKNGKYDDLETDINIVYEPQKSIAPVLIDISLAIENHRNEKNFNKIEKLCKKLDKYLDKLDIYDYDKAVILKDKVLKKIGEI